MLLDDVINIRLLTIIGKIISNYKRNHWRKAMPNWSQILDEIRGKRVNNPLDQTRHKYLSTMHKYTGRNIIAYYSDFLQNPSEKTGINDDDKNAFMQAVFGVDRSLGLDLILHTPGGEIAATASIVKYLQDIFGTNIRAFIPQIAMSAGTMIALSCKEIIMGRQSNIGPIDPQFGGLSCAGIIEEFETAIKETQKDQSTIPIWQVVVSKYSPTTLGECQKAIEWSSKLVKEWLCSNMLSDFADKEYRADKILKILGSHKETLNHANHIHINECKELGIVVRALEELDNRAIDTCKDLQDCVLSIHHAYMHTFSDSKATKIIENHLDGSMIFS